MIATVDPIEGAPTGADLGRVVTRLQQTVSASRLTLFHQCRLKFYFRYVAGIKKARTAALHVGSAVHSALKAWNKARWRGNPLDLRQLHESYITAWMDTEEGVVDWAAGEEADEQKTGWRLIETYIRECPISAEQKPEAVEVPVEADLAEHGLPRLIGILDLIQAGVIIDFKTASQTPNPERAVHMHEVQASIYSLLYREVTGKQEQGIALHHLVKLKNPKLVVTTLGAMNDEQQSRLFRVIESYVNGLDQRDFVPSPGLGCVSCEFFNECRRWH